MVLVVAGSWGAGEVEATVDDLVGKHGVVPVVVCGRNEELVRRLDVDERVRAIGWTTEMPSLMAAADLLIDNAGGLTAMEALAAGLPIISYRPLVGHGRDNAADMATAGVASLASDVDELHAAIELLSSDEDLRESQIRAGLAMFDLDGTDDVLAYAEGREVPLAEVVPLRASDRQKRRVKRVGAGIVATAMLVSVGLTTGVGEAAAHGLGGDHPGRHDAATYLGVRLNGAELADPATDQLLRELPATLVVDSATAFSHQSEMHSLVASGMEVANGGSGQHDPGWAPWSRARQDLQKATVQLNESTGTQVRLFLPCRRLDGFDLMYTHRMHQKALPTADSVKPGTESDALSDSGVFVLDGRRETVDQFRARLQSVQQMLAGEHANVLPLAHLV